MERLFKLTFFLAILLFCLLIVGVFLLIVKIILIFQPDINIMGLVIAYPPFY
jgi:hypothetical protein